MKKTGIILLFLALIVSLFPSPSYAQLRTYSNTVRTLVGNPPTDAPPVDDADLRQALIETFGITMNGFDTIHLRWVWEKLNEINDTSFPGMLRGSRVEAVSGGSSQVGCFGGEVSLYLGQYAGEAFYKFLIIHEFGHIIQACQPREKSKIVEHANAQTKEGFISYYSGRTLQCTGLNNGVNEDYADTLAYYFNPSAGFSSGPSACIPASEKSPPNPFFVQNAFPLHLNVAKDL